jgi:hypothetical protein
MGMKKPSSQGSSKPTIIKRPPLTTSRDNPGKGAGSNSGPKYGSRVKK